MRTTRVLTRPVLLLRWAARLWSLLVFAVALLVIVVPDPNATEPVPLGDWFLLSLWGVAILGLLVAWRWELAGGILTIATMFVRELAWTAIHGLWLPSFLIVWALVVPPAILFMVAWGMGAGDRRAG